MLESRPLPWSANTHALADPLYGTYIPPAPVDRPTLQKSLRALETLLVTLDEYRELSTRLSKVEKRLAKAGKELAVNMGDEKGANGSNGKGKEAYSMRE